MSTPTEEVQIDFDAIDRLKAEDAAKSAKKADPDIKDAPSTAQIEKTDEIEIVHAEPQAKAPLKEVLTPDAGLEKLKKQLDDEKKRADDEHEGRLDAERRAHEASEAEVKARTEVQGSQLDLVTTAIATIKQSNEALKAVYRQARADGDVDKEWEVQQTISENAAKLIQLEAGKTALEKAPKPTMRAPTDPVEQFCANLTPQSAAWVRAHPSYARDQKLTNKMIAAHNLVKDDVTVDSTEYFQAIERALGLKAPESPPLQDEDPTASAAQPAPVQRRAAPAAAPVSRSGGGNGSRPRTITLSAAQREAAEISGMTDQEYARHLVALRDEGKLN